MAARVVVESCMPQQNEKLPNIIEAIAMQAGQEFMKGYYRQAIEKADAELILSIREGKDGVGIQRIGKRRYTFKTIIGTVAVKRIRIRHKSDGVTEIPSARVWKSPKQVMITQGLK